jgi:hypothetical protein
MPSLTRRRSDNPRQETWRVYFGNVHVGAIARRIGQPLAVDPWQWRCGFHPGSRPGECTSGTAETFDEARSDFEAAWRVFLSNRTEADFRGGGIRRRGPPRSIAGSTEASGCPQTGDRAHDLRPAAPMPNC